MKTLNAPPLNIKLKFCSMCSFARIAMLFSCFVSCQLLRAMSFDYVPLEASGEIVGYNNATILPDSLPPDSIVYAEGDTVEVYTSGLDSIALIYTINTDSLLENAWAPTWPDTRMIVHASHLDYAVNQGVFGVNLTDLFEPGHGNLDDNDNYVNAPDPWEALITLAPKTVRIFSGAGGKFMHPLGSPQDPAVPTGLWNGGYGFRWEELVPFYDATDDPLLGGDAPSLPLLVANMADGVCTDCDDWMDKKFVGDFEDFYLKADAQPTFDPDDFPDPADRPLYINQCIDLIQQIEAANPGHVVDVIYVVNIQTQTASEVLEVVDYLRDNNIHITSLELGNEVYFDFHDLSMGFTAFSDYWNYINGVNFGDLDDILPADVYTDHNYILQIKGDPDYYDLKIGLPAANTPNCGADWDFPFTPPGTGLSGMTPILTDPEVVDPCPCVYSDWNGAMTAYYDETIVTGGVSRYKFDAIIFHNYYGPTNNTATCAENSNWRDILLDNLHPDYDPANLTTMILAPEYYTVEWDYVTTYPSPSAPDVNLITPFYGISGIHYPAYNTALLSGNYKDFTRTRIDNSYEEHAAQMLFTGSDTGPETKEVWVTEYNLDDKIDMPPTNIPGYTEPENNAVENGNESILAPIGASATNTFVHAAMMQQWFLWHLKSAYDPDYRDGFLTIATTQNFLSAGSTLGLIGRSDDADQIMLGEIGACGDDVLSPYYVRKALYFGALLQKPIIHNNLKYLKSNSALSVFNNNIPPTLFLKKDGFESTDDTLYIMYENKDVADQVYYIEPGTLVNDYGGAGGYEIALGSALVDGKMLRATQTYSTAGFTPLYLFNSYYFNCDDAFDRENEFELEGLESITPEITCPGAILAEYPGAVCIKVQPMSMGYVKIPFHVSPLRKGVLVDNYMLFPNPGSNYFSLYRKENAMTHDRMTGIVIYSMMGEEMMRKPINEGEPIPIANLPSGTYQILIQLENGNTEFEKLVKIE